MEKIGGGIKYITVLLVGEPSCITDLSMIF